MGRTSALRAEIRKRFWPHAAAKGFLRDERQAPALVTFRRHDADATLVFDIQWSKWGEPRFVVNFGKCPAGGFEFRGERIPPETVLAGWLVVIGQAGRLQPGRGSSTRSWFRQDNGWWARTLTGARLRSPAEVVDELSELFPEVEQYWSSGRIGPHLRVSPVAALER